ncbi:transmembrane protein 164 [Cimex lectularius]|uniref:Transmembrane protein 164 n=1 Tax=Cimex lectularius TaxID=79782 RepID=A0A8I6S5Z3_CIMLE|nr:transmembrane protein 164 [Cimex lectularius]XP_024084655.1 transmembrane protein 164 [Cimex lectularius]
MLEWAVQGVNISVPRNGGLECANFLSMKTRTLETIFVLCLCGPTFMWGMRRLTPLNIDCQEKREPTGKRVLLVMMCLIWGIEIGYKFSSRTVIFLLNPCHITTALQIYLLVARPSKRVGALFRFQMNCMNGAVLALAFPELDALNLPFETWLYWIQHSMMMVIPLYLIQLGGVYEVEKLNDFSWSLVSYCILVFYHFIILQGIGLPTQVNLNHMLCPAIRDPFDGPWYRPIATTHQAFLCPMLSKFFAFVGHKLSTPPRKKYH